MSRAISDFSEPPDSDFDGEFFYSPEFEISVLRTVSNFYGFENSLFLSPI